MNKLSDYITIEEAAEITKKSISTIRRFVTTHKHSKNDVIRIDTNDKNRPLYRINKNFILAYFDITRKNGKIKNDNSPESAEFFKKKIIKGYLYYKNAYITTRRLLVLSIFLTVVLIVVFFLFGYSYKKELIERYERETAQFQKEIDMLEKEVEGSRASIELYDKQHQKYDTKQDIEIKVLLDRINEMEDLLKQNYLITNPKKTAK